MWDSGGVTVRPEMSNLIYGQPPSDPYFHHNAFRIRPSLGPSRFSSFPEK